MNIRKYMSLAFHEELAYHSLSLLNKIFYELALKTILEPPLPTESSGE